MNDMSSNYVLYYAEYLRHDAQQSRKYKQHRQHHRQSEQKTLSASTLLIGCTKIITSEGPTQTRSTLLQENCCYKQNGENYLDIRQYRKYDSSYQFHVERIVPETALRGKRIRKSFIFLSRLVVICLKFNQNYKTRRHQ